MHRTLHNWLRVANSSQVKTSLLRASQTKPFKTRSTLKIVSTRLTHRRNSHIDLVQKAFSVAAVTKDPCRTSSRSLAEASWVRHSSTHPTTLMEEAQTLSKEGLILNRSLPTIRRVQWCPSRTSCTIARWLENRTMLTTGHLHYLTTLVKALLICNRTPNSELKALPWCQGSLTCQRWDRTNNRNSILRAKALAAPSMEWQACGSTLAQLIELLRQCRI